jgi:sulfide:quinone oxidoreductase
MILKDARRMEIRKISPQISVSAQISPDDVTEIRDAGYRAIICNRPDGEGPVQPSFGQIAEAAKSAGIEARYVPIEPGMVGSDQVDAFRSALEELPRPLLAYCRSGARSLTLCAFVDVQ